MTRTSSASSAEIAAGARSTAARSAHLGNFRAIAPACARLCRASGKQERRLLPLARKRLVIPLYPCRRPRVVTSKFTSRDGEESSQLLARAEQSDRAPLR